MFLNPIMLAGVAGAVLPLVLHFLSRARYRSVDWGGMMFLDPSRARRHHGSGLKELSILLLRMAIVSTLAMALSRPVLGSGASASQQTSMVILLDRSASLLAEENGPPRKESARRAAVEALDTLRPGDEAAVLLLPETVPALGSSKFTTDLQSLVALVNDQRTNPADGRADVAAGLKAAAHLLEMSHALNRQIVLVCDRQAVNWRDINDSFAQNWRQSVTDPSGRMPQFSVIPVGGSEAGNVAIESVQVVNPPIVRNVPAELEVQVHNYDTISSTALTLAVSYGNRDQFREPAGDLYRTPTPLNLPAGESITVRCPVKISSTGQQVITASITPKSGLLFDDSLDSVFDVVDSIGVLIITGEPLSDRLNSFRSGSELIHLALAPMKMAGQAGAADVARVQVVQSGDWPQLDASKYGVVILANAPRLSPSQVEDLEQFTYGGGGVIVAPGNLVRADEYNAQLWRGGAGLLPAQLDAATPADGSRSTSLLGLDLNHPIFHFLKDRQEPLPKVTIGRYFPASVTEPRSKVIGRYASGQPFMVEGSFGRGRVLLFTTSLDAEWNTLPLTNTYLPLLQSAVRYLQSGSQVDRNLNFNDPIVTTFEGVTNPRVTLTTYPPSGSVVLNPVPIGSGYEVTYPGANRIGQYRLHIDGDAVNTSTLFVVRASRDESDLTSLTPRQSQKLSQSLGFEWVDSEPQTIVSAMTRARKQRELWPLLIGAVIGLGLLELLLECMWTVNSEKEVAA